MRRPTPLPPPTGPQTTLLLAQQTACYYYDGGRIYTGDQGRYWLYSGYRGVEAIDSYWFYGDQITKVAGTTVSKIEMWVQRATGVGARAPQGSAFGLTAPPQEDPAASLELPAGLEKFLGR